MVLPSSVRVWIQIHKILALPKTLSIVKQLVGIVGKELEVEMNVMSNEQGDFHRAIEFESIQGFGTLCDFGTRGVLGNALYR